MSDDYSRTDIHDTRIFTIVIGTISTIMPLTVVFILLQRYKELVSGKSLMHYVLMIAIGDTLAAFGVALGFPLPGSAMCTIQGILICFFSRMSWFYTDCLIIQLYSLVIFKRYFLNLRYMHMIVWGINILLQILPFTTGTYYGGFAGTDDNHLGYTTCEYSPGIGSDRDSHFWFQYAFNIWLLISFGIISILSTIIVVYVFIQKKNAQSSNVLTQRIQGSWSIVILYPLAMFITWVPFQLFQFYALHYALYVDDTLGGMKYYDFILISNYLTAYACLYGPLLTIIFYMKTLDAWKAWMNNLRCIIQLVVVHEVYDRSTCQSIFSVDDRYVSESEVQSDQSVVSELKKVAIRMFSSSIDTSNPTIQPQVNPMMNDDSIVRIQDEI